MDNSPPEVISIDDDAGSNGSDEILTSDGTPPTLVSIAENDTFGKPISSRTFTVTFSESVVGFDSTDVLLDGTAGATTATVSGSGSVYTVTVSGMTQTGSITLAIPSGIANDAAGNATVSGDTLTVGYGGFLVAGADAGGGPHVLVRDVVTGEIKFNFFAYADGFTGGVRVATGDVNGDGTPDIITAAGAGGGPHVRIFDGNDLSVIHEFFAYVNGFTGGVFVASGDVNGDGIDDVITGAGAGGAAHVQVFGGGGVGLLGSFFAYDPGFAGGVQVAVGDVNGDGLADIITGAGPGGSPHVKVIDARSLTQLQPSGQIQDAALLASFFAFDPAFAGGVFVAAEDTNGDGRADILLGAGAGGGPHVKLVDGFRATTLDPSGVISDSALLANFFAYESLVVPGSGTQQPFSGGVHVSFADLDGDGRDDTITAPGAGAILPVQAHDASTLTEIDSFFAFENFAGGVFV